MSNRIYRIIIAILICIFSLNAQENFIKDKRDHNSYIKPNVVKSEEHKASQNIEKEEYAVYDELISDWNKAADIRQIVIKKFTNGEDSNNKIYDGDYFAVRGVENETVKDFTEKNKRKSYQLQKNLFEKSSKIILISDLEVSRIFEKECTKGWDKFYEKFPKSQGITTVSRVGFNKNKTKALVYSGTQSLCLDGSGFFVILEKKNHEWIILKREMMWIS